MEKIKVNMSPNPLDVQTIHASQNDGEARQWEFELHNNGELIDTSEITEQLFFKAYKGGTEQLLPENTSTPTTSPFLGDIKYPQGLLTDQEFTYRQSPTEEDGLAKITDIKGNTLVWNQLVQNGNFVDTSLWRTYASTGFSVSNNVGSFTVTGATGAIYQTNTPTYVSGHKYLVIADFYVSQQSNISVEVSGTRGKAVSVNANTWYRYSDIVAPSAQGNFSLTCGQASVQVKNVMCFDITKMGLDSITADEFTSLFPLSYYAYNQGSLLSFNGNGIKTVSKNQFDTQVVTTSYQGLTLTKTQGTIRAVYSGGSQYAGFNFYGSPVFTDTFLKGKYRLSFDVKGLDTQWTVGLRRGASFLGGGQAHAISNDGHYSFTIDTEANPNCYLSFSRTGNKTIAYDVTFSNIQLELGTTETPYTPFEEKTISLPISTYFPTGMKSAGNVFDELTESKAITRIGAVDLGSLTWTMASNNRFISTGIASTIKAPSSNVVKANILCAVYETQTYSGLVDSGLLGVAVNANSPNTGNICIKDTTYSSASDFKTAMNGVYLYYELATPTETSFTTASLVTENAEIPLSNEDGTLIGKCTEQLSENPGFIDAKIKLADADGTCYSNKLQLHVERSPQ